MKCSRCQKKKDEFDFYFERGRPRSICKECTRASRNLYYSRNRERSIAAVKRWAESPEGSAKRKAWLAARAKTPKQIEYQRRWSKTKKGLEARRRRVNRFSKTPKGHAANKRRSARRRAVVGTIVATLTAAQWSDILAAHNFSCAYCHVSFSKTIPATQDHVIPISRGGHHTKENVVPACKPCNSRKKDKIL